MHIHYITINGQNILFYLVYYTVDCTWWKTSLLCKVEMYILVTIVFSYCMKYIHTFKDLFFRWLLLTCLDNIAFIQLASLDNLLGLRYVVAERDFILSIEGNVFKFLNWSWCWEIHGSASIPVFLKAFWWVPFCWSPTLGVSASFICVQYCK